jgi:hypothetical protein
MLFTNLELETGRTMFMRWDAPGVTLEGDARKVFYDTTEKLMTHAQMLVHMTPAKE